MRKRPLERAAFFVTYFTDLTPVPSAIPQVANLNDGGISPPLVVMVSEVAEAEFCVTSVSGEGRARLSRRGGLVAAIAGQKRRKLIDGAADGGNEGF